MIMWKCLPSSETPGPHNLSSSHSQFSGASSNGIQQELPRVKLTGSGKMPLMDMRSNNIIQNYENSPQSLNYPQQVTCNQPQLNPNNKNPGDQERINSPLDSCIHPTVVGLPPKSPVYAVINKANKRQLEKQSHKNNVQSLTSPNRGDIYR